MTVDLLIASFGKHIPRLRTAASNPSMSPLEAALSLMNMSRPPQASRTITRAALVEAPTKASQEAASKAVLASYAPGVELEYEVAALAPTAR